MIDNDPETYEERCSAAVDMLRRADYTQTALEHLSTVTLLYETNAAGARVAQMLQYTWREKLGIQVDVRGVAPEEMQATLESGEFSLALTSVSADRNTALSYLNRFSSGQKEIMGSYTPTPMIC